MSQSHARRIAVVAIAIAAIASAACGGGAGGAPLPRMMAARDGVPLRVERVVGAKVAAAFAFAPADGRLWYGELETGRIISGGKTRWDFAVSRGGESGIESIAIAPDGGSLVAYISVPKGDPSDASADGGEAMVSRVVRLTIDGEALRDPATILEVPSTGIHNAGAVGFGPDGLLYVDIGDNHDFGESQDVGSPFGKILRITLDGAAAAGNPFADRAGADARVWAYGIRNTFAFAWTADGRMIGADDGDTGDDEINDLRAGESYGWPPLDSGARPGAVAPIRIFRQTIAPAGLAIVPPSYGAWGDGHHAVVCGFVSQTMQLIDLDDASSPPITVADRCSLHIAIDGGGAIVFSNADGVYRVGADR